MPTIDMYGRNPDVEATAFSYPYPLVADTPQDPASHRWFTLPSTSYPVFGNPHFRPGSIEDTHVVVDPTNPIYTRREGLGYMPMLGPYGMFEAGADAAAEVTDKPWLMERIDTARKAFEPRKKGTTAKVDKGITTFADFWNRQSGPAQTVLTIVGALIGWNILKSFGR